MSKPLSDEGKRHLLAQWTASQYRRPAQADLVPAGTVTLPSFVMSESQPDLPHNARTIATYTSSKGIVFRVRQDRPGKTWTIDASMGNLRWSNTLRTTSKAKAESWVAAVEAGRVRARS